MKVYEALQFARENLIVENSPKEANILLSTFLQKPLNWLITHENEPIPSSLYFKDWIKRRNAHEPLEYITQEVCFYSEIFFITKGVLIPRPETEILVDIVNNKLKQIQNPKMLEIGIGSGIISIMLLLLNPNLHVTATDISIKALEVAYKNAIKFGVNDRIKFSFCSFEEDVKGDFDLLVSNPPYIPNKTILPQNVMQEPHIALFGGNKGYEFLEKLIHITKKRNIKTLACEIGYDQKDILKNILTQNNVKEYSFYKDLSSLDRGFIANF